MRWAFGAKVRISYDDGTFGPAREIQSGSGYWTQNSATVTLGKRFGVFSNGIEVQWPDGSKSVFEFSHQATLVSVDANERLKVMK